MQVDDFPKIKTPAAGWSTCLNPIPWGVPFQQQKCLMITPAVDDARVVRRSATKDN